MTAKPPVLKQLQKTQRHVEKLAIQGKVVPPELQHQADVLKVAVIGGGQKGHKQSVADVAGVRHPVSRLGGG